MTLNTYRHFVPGYHHAVPLGQNTFSPPRLCLSQRLCRFQPGVLTWFHPWNHPPRRRALKRNARERAGFPGVETQKR
jgi:hypothetical protein